MRDRLEWLLLITLTALLGSGWIYLSRETGTAGQPIALTTAPYVGALAPDFTLQTVAGESVTLSDFMANGPTPVVLNFWATWCPPCRAEMPALQAVAQAYREQGVRVLGVNQAEEPNQVVGFMQTLGLDFPVLLDRDAAVSQLYRVRSLPTTFFIDREGVIREIVIGGPMSQALLASKMESLLK